MSVAVIQQKISLLRFKDYIDDNNRLLMIAIACPVVSAIFCYIFTLVLVEAVISGILLLALGIADYRMIKKREITPPHWMWLGFMPVYIWKRGRDKKESRMMLVAVFASLFLSAVISQANITNYIEDVSCQAVNDILKSRNVVHNSCMSVNLGNQISTNFWRAESELASGKIAKLSVKLTDKGKVRVTLLN